MCILNPGKWDTEEVLFLQKEKFFFFWLIINDNLAYLIFFIKRNANLANSEVVSWANQQQNLACAWTG